MVRAHACRSHAALFLCPFPIRVLAWSVGQLRIDRDDRVRRDAGWRHHDDCGHRHGGHRGGRRPGDGGLATAAQLYYPNGLTVDGSGNIFVADTGNHRVRQVSAATGNIATIAGTGTPGYNGDGPATGASLNYPAGVAVDGPGNVYIA